MAQDSKIEWTHHTWNPWIGCTQVSPACDHCYAKTLVNGRMAGNFDERRRTGIQNWNLPLRWDRLARKELRRARVFTASLADFWDNQVDPDWRLDALDVIRRTRMLDWQVLTKRPQNIKRMLAEAARLAAGSGRVELARWLEAWLAGNPPPHVWLGTTVEDQVEADRRIPHLLAVPAKVRFLSCEPLLGPVDLTGWLRPHDGGPCPVSDPDCLGGEGDCHDACTRPPSPIHWVICGGESGAGARPMHPDWARSLRDQCATAGVPFFAKQMGGPVKAKMPPIPSDLMIREFPYAAG